MNDATVIVGAGVIGAGIALELTRRGHDVIVLDKGPAAGHGSTAASSAIVRYTYTTATGTALAYEGLPYWRSWDEHVRLPPGAQLTRFVECGMLLLDDGSGVVGAVRPALDEVGLPYEWWDADRLVERIPLLTADDHHPPTLPSDDRFWEASGRVAGALWTGEAGYVTDPQLAAQNLADAATAEGATFRFRSEVTAISVADGRVTAVEIAGGDTIPCSVLVNAAGPHSAHVEWLAGVEGGVRTRPLRQQAAYVHDGSDRLSALPIVGDLGSGFYIRPELGSGILVGSTEPDCDPRVWVDDPDELDDQLDRDEFAIQMLRFARRVPDAGVPHELRGVVGLYDVADDWKPIIDRSDLDGYFTAIGTSGNQFKNAAIIGFCLGELVEAVAAGHDHDREPLVVTGPHHGLAIDLGAFSRRRPVGAGAHGVIG
ncbi:MAG: NAD(P)/FAD-dependent oxidoreductase [Ilumatobacteraceae bacterium]